MDKSLLAMLEKLNSCVFQCRFFFVRKGEKTARVYGWLESARDPEIPVLSILDLSIVRD
jgi:hypothetical protein